MTEYAVTLKDEVHRLSRVGCKCLSALFNHLAFPLAQCGTLAAHISHLILVPEG